MLSDVVFEDDSCISEIQKLVDLNQNNSARICVQIPSKDCCKKCQGNLIQIRRKNDFIYLKNFNHFRDY